MELPDGFGLEEGRIAFSLAPLSIAFALVWRLVCEEALCELAAKVITATRSLDILIPQVSVHRYIYIFSKNYKGEDYIFKLLIKRAFIQALIRLVKRQWFLHCLASHAAAAWLAR